MLDTRSSFFSQYTLAIHGENILNGKYDLGTNVSQDLCQCRLMELSVGLARGH